MNDNLFIEWCQTATEKIRYGPDREAVTRELMGHLEDHRDTLMELGLSKKDAEQKAVSAMGSAREIAPQLAAIHNPWLGYLSGIIKAAAILTAIFAIYLFVGTIGSFLHTLITTRNFDSIPANHSQLDYYCHPNVSDSSDGFRFQITEAGYSKTQSELYFQLEKICWPWIDKKGDIVAYFWATDSLGNYYHAIAEEAYDSPTRVTRGGGMSSSLISLISMQLTGFDTEAQWVELHYDRDGRDIVLRIDLTGGDEDG